MHVALMSRPSGGNIEVRRKLAVRSRTLTNTRQGTERQSSTADGRKDGQLVRARRGKSCSARDKYQSVPFLTSDVPPVQRVTLSSQSNSRKNAGESRSQSCKCATASKSAQTKGKQQVIELKEVVVM